MTDSPSTAWSPQAGQLLPFLCPLNIKEVLLTGNRGGGKGLSNDSAVLTTTGWVTAGNITTEHLLVAPDGTSTKIKNIWKRPTGPLFKFIFDDGATVTTDDVHKWAIRTESTGWAIRDTSYLLQHSLDWEIPGFKSGKNKQIKSIERVYDGPSTCFEVDHKSHQFVCQDFIVTHNSDCLLVSFLRGVGRGWGANWRGLCLKRTVPEIGPLFEKAKLIYQANCPGIKYTQHPYAKFVWPTGEMLTLRHMLDADDYNDVHGSEYQWIAWEELSTWGTPEVYLRCMSLLRSSHPEASKWMQIWSSTNPGSIGHNWIRRRWKLPEMVNQIIYDEDSDTDKEEMSRWSDDPLVNVKSRPRIAIFLDVRKNEIFMKQNPTYLADLARQAPNESTRRAWIDGSWDCVTGGMFDDVWDQRYHVVKPFPIPRAWKVDRSLDWGSSTPFCVLWYAESDGGDYQDAEGIWHSSIPGDIFVIYEWYGTNGQINQGLKLTADEVAKGIVERELEWGIYERVYPGPADNQIHMEIQAGQNIASDMLREIRLEDGREFPGVTWTRSDKGDGSRVTGWNMIRDRLKRCVPDPKSPVLREQPGLFFFKSLNHTLQHFPVTPRDEKKPDDVPNRGEFHIQDTLRYRILSDGRGVTSGPTVGKY